MLVSSLASPGPFGGQVHHAQPGLAASLQLSHDDPGGFELAGGGGLGQCVGQGDFDGVRCRRARTFCVRLIATRPEGCGTIRTAASRFLRGFQGIPWGDSLSPTVAAKGVTKA